MGGNELLSTDLGSFCHLQDFDVPIWKQVTIKFVGRNIKEGWNFPLRLLLSLVVLFLEHSDSVSGTIYKM